MNRYDYIEHEIDEVKEAEVQACILISMMRSLVMDKFPAKEIQNYVETIKQLAQESGQDMNFLIDKAFEEEKEISFPNEVTLEVITLLVGEES